MAATDSTSVTPSSPADIEATKQKFAAFVERNPTVSFRAGRGAFSGRKIIRKPWGEDAIVLVVPENEDAFATILNAVSLPNRFSAVWHADTHDFEVIWTAFQPNNQIEEFSARAFTFSYKGAH